MKKRRVRTKKTITRTKNPRSFTIYYEEITILSQEISIYIKVDMVAVRCFMTYPKIDEKLCNYVRKGGVIEEKR
uniref:Histone domain-containing protein n=1 Tax=Heterorhabditis bacteriophora TaxID=37862 RepID=A0A1I7X198_HETBA